MQREHPGDGFTAAAELLRSRRRIPVATYRLQFGSAFTFNDARRIVPYLASLGISHVYASPILKSGPGGHGYDICDHSALDPAIGTDADFGAFVDALHAHAMGLILDVVPNHMGIATECNRWWMDVLEHGPSSPYARFFDIDWHPATAAFHDKVLLPILEDQYGRVLEAGLLRLVFGDAGFRIRYHDRTLPVAPRTWTLVLALHLDSLLQDPGADDPHVLELQSIMTAISHLPPRNEADQDRIAEGRREADVIRRRVAGVYAASMDVRAAIDRAVRAINGRAGEPESFERLDALLDAQAYRPAYWRVASEEINYRRFF
ncbi:MAG TPA: alpha-amylase family glycosyl hydrolase, partial [Dehalococcoidia bacterium]|nr:alpha-amylase family glycosyl hydrolase [Dehalococcoidia bacterium]